MPSCLCRAGECGALEIKGISIEHYDFMGGYLAVKNGQVMLVKRTASKDVEI
jgi:hypothetical protein